MSSGNDSPSVTRNPSPPPELQGNVDLLEADTIHNTTFSKHWLFSTLMKLIEEVDREEADQEESEFGLDVDEEIQNELCKLWDMSMNSEVSMFLHEFKAIDILAGVIGKSKAPRVTEISMGILGNMACVEDICVAMAQNSKLRGLVLLLLESTDPQTLSETTRFLHTSLSNQDARDEWIQSINGESIRDNITFILRSSTNCDLLKNTGDFVDILLDLNEELCESWATSDFIHALLEAIKQIGCHHSEALETYFHILQLFSTTENGVETLVECAIEVEEPLMKYLNIVCEDEIVGLECREACLASALSILNIIFSASEDTANRLIKDEKLIRIFLKILEPLYPWLQSLNSSKKTAVEVKQTSYQSKQLSTQTNLKTDKNNSANDITKTKSSTNQTTAFTSSNENVSNMKNPDQSASITCNSNPESASGSRLQETDCREEDEEKIRQHLSLLYNIVQGFTYDYFFTMHMASEEDEDNDNGDDNKPSSNSKSDLCMNTITYLNSSSSRRRISYLVLTLKESITPDFNPVDTLLMLAETQKQERLARIIRDTLSGQSLMREWSDSSTGGEPVGGEPVGHEPAGGEQAGESVVGECSDSSTGFEQVVEQENI